MDSDDTSTNTVFHTISQINTSDIKPIHFFPTPFQPLHTQIPDEPSSAPSSYTDANSIYSPMTSDPPGHSSPVDAELGNDLDNFITLQQQLQPPSTLTIHHLLQTVSSSESSNPPFTTGETRAHRVSKRNLPNSPFPSNPRPAQTFWNHPLHTNTKEFLQVCLPFFLQYTYYRSNPNDDQPNYVDENVLFLTLSWTSQYHFSNPLSLPLLII